MEDLTPYTRYLQQWDNYSPLEAKQEQIGRLLRKVKIKLTKSQYKALYAIMGFWLTAMDGKFYGLSKQANYLQVYRLYTSKIQKAPFNIKPAVTLSLDLIQAETLMSTLLEYHFDSTSYEMQVVNYIIQEIDKQTV